MCVMYTDGDLGRASKEVDLVGVSGVRVRGKDTVNLLGLVKFQVPNSPPKGDIQKAVGYIRCRLENNGYWWYLNLVAGV